MATRLYLSRGTAPVTPASGTYTGGTTQTWESPAAPGPTTLLLMSTADYAASTFATTAYAHNGVANADVCGLKFVSAQLSGAQTITGTLIGQMRIGESQATLNAHGQIMAKVVSGDGATLRGVLYGGDSRTGTVDEMTVTSTFSNQKIPATSISPVTLTSVAAQDGDRILIEIGHRANATVTTNCNLRAGTTATAGGANDLTVGGAEITDLNPWVEFSQTLTFATGQINVSPTGFAETEAFGTESAQIGATPTGFGDTESFGTDTAQIGAAPTGFAETEAFGTEATQLGVAPTSFAETESFGTPSAGPAPTIVSPTGFADTEAFGTESAQLGAGPTGFAETEAFGTEALQPSVSATGFADSETFGTENIQLRPGPTGFAETEAFGTPTAATPPAGPAPTGFADVEAFGIPAIQLGAGPIGFADSEAFGTLEIALFIAAAGFADVEAFGVFVASDASAPMPSLMLPNRGRNTATLTWMLDAAFPRSYRASNIVDESKSTATVTSDGRDAASVDR